MSTRLAEMSDYNRMISDRPDKLSAAQVIYLSPRANLTGRECAECLHFFTSRAARRQVCEIFRPANDRPVDKQGVCRFWTRTGERFPLYDRLTHQSEVNER